MQIKAIEWSSEGSNIKMQDITPLSKSAKAEIAGYIKRDNLKIVNQKLPKVKIKDTFYTRYGKRVLDFTIGLVGFTVSLPINLVLAIATFFDVGRPIIFKQDRVGKNEKIFTLYKFRNMTNETDAHGELLPPDQRVTKWGKFVRKTSLDELLNFWPILKGDMSVIGPRPLLVYYRDRLNNRHKAIYAVRPGLECPPLKDPDRALTWQDRLDNYVWYVENCSFLLDIRLAFRIVQIAFDSKNTESRETASNGEILGYDLNGNIIYSKNVPDKFVDEYCKAHGYLDLEDAIAARDKAE